MTTAEMIRISTSLVSEAGIGVARLGRLLRRLLLFSLADDRIAPRRRLFALLESGGVSVLSCMRFLSRIRIRQTRHYPFEPGAYPTPENLASAVALAVSELKAVGTRITLVIPEAWAVVKTTEFPRVVKDTLSDVVAFELDRLTPLSPERSFYDFRILAEDETRLRILVAAVRAERLQPYLDALTKRGITVEGVGLPEAEAVCALPEDGRNVSNGVNLLDRGVHRRPKIPLALTFILLTLLAAAGLFWMVSPLQTEQRRIEMIEQEIAARKDEIRKVEALKKEAEGLEKEIAAINAFRGARPMTLNLLKEMTRILPNSVWLSRVRFTESTAEIEGYAISATDILPKLEASPYFTKVEFASPTTRDTRLNADRFIIKMEIEGLPEGKEQNEQKK